MGRLTRTARCALRTLLPFLLLPLPGCGVRGGAGGATARRAAAAPRAQSAMLAALDPAEAYRRAGLLSASGPVSFVGTVRVLAGPAPDSVLVVVAVSLPSRSLTFTREGERYRAAYGVEFDLLQQSEGTARVAARINARETVRVSSLRETTREEESVIFQQLVVAPPGAYTAALTVRDLGSTRSGTAEAPVTAPRFTTGRDAAGAARTVGLATPVTIHAASPRASRAAVPDLVVNARSTAIFGRDTVIRVYLEWYGIDGAAVSDRTVNRPPALHFSVRAADGRELHADSVVAGAWGADGQLAAATAHLPVAKIGLGQSRIAAWRPGGRDTVSAPIFVSAVDDLAAVSFDEMLGYLRYFTTGERLRALRDTAPELRAAAWAAFLRSTDASPATPEHERLREYFGRLEIANARFRGEEVPGWLTDRGMVYITLGDADRVVEPTAGEARSRGRAQLWEYAQHRLRLVFVEQNGAGRWRLTPASEAEFQTVAERVKR